MKKGKTTNETVGWLTGTGRDSDIVLSSRIRLARNIDGFSFLSKISPAQQRELSLLLRDTILTAELADDMEFIQLNELPEVDRQLLVERHLISKELARAEGERGVAVGRRETLSIMVNEEDHLRLQVLHAGFELDEVWRAISEVDDALASRLPYAFSKELGYLTACPTNVGTGLRVSVMLHLPGMVMTRHLEKVFNAVGKLNLVVRGLYGEGTQAVGDLYQVSNQRTLGKTEEDIIGNLAAVVPQVIDYERQVREAILREGKSLIEDQAWRAYGILSAARSIASEEALYLLSRVRLGVNMGLIDRIDVAAINRLHMLTQPAHVQRHHGRKLSSEDRNRLRADLIRAALAEVAAG